MASLRFEYVVVGGGITGAAAALALKDRGKSVGVVAESAGATAVSSGAWDFGPLPPSPPKSPLSFLDARRAEDWRTVKSDLLLGRPVDELLDGQKAEIDSIAAAFKDELELSFSLDNAFTLPTSAGTWKRVFGAQAIQARAHIANLEGLKVALVASRQWRFPSELIASRLQATAQAAGIKLDLSPMWLELKGADWPLPQLATRLAHDLRFKDAFREKLKASLEVTAYSALLFPPLFLDPAYCDSLSKELNVPVAEMLATTEPIAGRRLSKAITGTLARLSIPYYAVSGLTPEIAKGRIVSLHGGAGPRSGAAGRGSAVGSSEFRADKFVLATGKYFGGGIRHGYDRLQETIFDLPLFVSRASGRKQWRRSLDWAGDSHCLTSPAWASLGVWVDNQWRPIDEAGKPVFPNLAAVGSLIGGLDYPKVGIGTGFFALTGRRCGTEI